jgi:hypothetical protein
MAANRWWRLGRSYSKCVRDVAFVVITIGLIDKFGLTGKALVDYLKEKKGRLASQHNIQKY